MEKERMDKTAKLAAAFGMILLRADTLAEAKANLDARTARELSVISRVLEKRLVETRTSVLASTVSLPRPLNPAA